MGWKVKLQTICRGLGMCPISMPRMRLWFLNDALGSVKGLMHAITRRITWECTSLKQIVLNRGVTGGHVGMTQTSCSTGSYLPG